MNETDISIEQTSSESVAEPAPAETSEKEYQPKGLAKVLNKFFHFKEKGSTMSKEVWAGIAVFLLSVVVLLMNTRIIAEAVDADSAAYCGIYLAAAIMAFLGSLAIGLIARLPLVQVSSLGLSSSFIALIGADNGLTYQNLLAVSFISAIIYTVLVSVPVVKKFLFESLPSPVRKALPVAMGIFIILYALSDIGVLSVSSTGTFNTIAIGDLSNSMYILGAVAAVVAAVITFALILIKKHVSHPVFFGILCGAIAFYVGGLVLGFTLVYSVNRAYIVAGAENMYTIAAGFGGLDFGSVFTSGFDFSAYTGSVGQLFVYGILTFMFMSMYESEGNMRAAALYNDSLDADDFKTVNTMLTVNAVTNLVAPIFGSMPLTVGKASPAAAHDGGKSGLTAVVASIGFLIACFIWVFFALLATYTATVTDYGHATSNSYAEYAQATFAFIDGVMIIIGLFSFKAIGQIDASDMSQLLPFAAVIVGVVATSNIVFAVAFGVFAYVLCKLLTFDVKKILSIGIPTCVLTVLLIIVLALM